MKWLSRIGVRLDTSGGRAKMKAFKSGWASQTSNDIKFFRSPKVQYRYRERGTGPTIVLNADPPVTLEMYDELLEVFSTRFRVIILEMPAMGFSATQNDYHFGFRETSDDLAIFLRAIAGEGAVLALCCVSGLGAVDLAVRYPDLVSKLVLLQVADVEGFDRWKSGRDPKGLLAKPVIGQYAMKKVAPKRMPIWFDLCIGRREKIDAICTCTHEALEKGAMWSLASAYQVYMDPEIELGKPQQPVLAIWGLADATHPSENAQTPMNLAETVKYVPLESLGHSPELEDPQAVFKIVSEFVDEEAV